jgi:uroporphyrinogen-III synthase
MLPESALTPSSSERTRAVVALRDSQSDNAVGSAFRRLGTGVLTVPQVEPAFSAELEEARGLLDLLAKRPFDVVVFMSGGAVASLLELARELERSSDLVRGLRGSSLVCRGPKAAAVVRRARLAEPGNLHQPLGDHRLHPTIMGLVSSGNRVLRVNGVPGDALATRLLARRAFLCDVSMNVRIPWAPGARTSPAPVVGDHVVSPD